MKLNLILFAILVTFVLGSESAKKQINSKCNHKSVQKIDKQMSPLIPLFSGGKLPENENQLQKYCASVSPSIDSAAVYLKTCGGTFGPFMHKTMTTSVKKELNSICKLRNQKLVDQLLTAGKCANSVTNKLNKCLNNMLDTMTALQSVPFDDKINTGCCHAYKIVSCIMRTVVKSKRCDKDMLENVERQLLVEFGDFCGQYFSDNQKCNKLIANTPKLNNTYVRPKSIFQPMVGLMDSFRNMKCTVQTEQKIDGFVEQMLTIGTPEKIPENSEQMSKWCSNAKQALPMFYGYIESCLSDFGKFLVKVMVGAVATNFEPYCSREGVKILDNPDPQMQEYIKAAKCGNRAEDKIKTCLNDFSVRMYGIIESPEMSRIKMSCCNAYNFRTCVFNATSATKGCSAQNIDWAERQVLNNVESAINLVCNDLWGNTKKCDRILAEIAIVDPKTYVKPKSPFFPMMRVLESFPDVDLEKK